LWLSSYIVPIHKSGDPFDPNNYRGISLLNGIAKIFSAILNNRIMLHMKDKFSNVQFVFRPNMRTADSLFIFKTLINKYFNLLKKIRVITKLPNSEQSYKGKVKTHNYINRQNQSTTGKL
jgi:hypothetical protein